MLNSKKFLYIMPDSAYIAELLPSKKAHTYSVQVFRQINGEFILDDNEFLAENIDKLIKKIDPEEYELVLPDSLFTNTIVDVKEINENEVKKYIKDELLPSLELSKDTHQVTTFTLTQHKGVSKVQLSALENSILAPLQKACTEQKIVITHITPLSWTLKSVISLEPSLSTIQMGGMLFLAQHYIGVDQTISFKIEDAANIAETVKTLKGAEPNIQTMYLLTNALVENELKEKLSGTLPLQQLATVIEEQEGMPAHIKQIIEAGAKTLDIADYPVPHFDLGKYDPSQPTPTVSEKNSPVSKGESVLPTPHLPVTPLISSQPPKVEPSVIEPVAKASEPKPPEKQAEAPPIFKAAAPSVSLNAALATPAVTATPPVSANVVPLGYMQEQDHPIETQSNPPYTAPDLRTRKIIKNKSGAGSLVRVVAITLGALLITVGLGVGIGFGLLSYTQNKNQSPANEIASASPTGTPEASLSPTPSPSPTTVAKDKVKILVVNATKTAGKAGKLKTTLTTAGYKTVDTGNAKGTYNTPGTFVLMSSQDQAFISTLTKDAGVDVTYSADKASEDSAGAYDVVIVLNE